MKMQLHTPYFSLVKYMCQHAQFVGFSAHLSPLLWNINNKTRNSSRGWDLLVQIFRNCSRKRPRSIPRIWLFTMGPHLHKFIQSRRHEIGLKKTIFWHKYTRMRAIVMFFLERATRWTDWTYNMAFPQELVDSRHCKFKARNSSL